MIRVIIAGIFLSIGMFVGHVDALDVEPVRPNILFILADDLGWSDTTLYGTTKYYETPNLERLARRGVTFTRAYSASPLCSPTRASILTGQNPARIGITSPSCHVAQVQMEATVAKSAPATSKSLQCQSATRFKTEYYTLAETLKDSGYATGHFGKWHLGPEPFDPLHQGFDVDVPHWPGPGPAGSYVAPWRFPRFKERSPGEHIEDRMGDEAVAFIEQHQDQPFFLNYWQFSVHAPFDAKHDLIEKHRKRVDPNSPQRSPTYAAMVESLDDNVGKMLDALERLGIADRTIVIFFSDNGGNMYNEIDGTTPTSNLPLRGGKATMYEGGVRVPCIVSWPGVTRPGSRSDAMIQSTDFYPTIVDLLDLQPAIPIWFDGTSIRAALQGQAFERGAIFTFFPHSPKVPDHLPPAVSVHVGDWKLIRVFYDGEGSRHRYELYDLSEDIGESRNLAAQHPERVQELDARITEFLRETNAVVPQLNPKYDPSSVELADAGITGLNDCRASLADGQLLINSTGGDPHFQLRLANPVSSHSLTFELTMKSGVPGKAQLFWQEVRVTPAFFRDRSVVFQPQTDDEFHIYRLPFAPKKDVVSLRLDPAQGPGAVVIQRARLVDQNGYLVCEWLPAKGKE